jgi:hypothetical protein
MATQQALSMSSPAAAPISSLCSRGSIPCDSRLFKVACAAVLRDAVNKHRAPVT